MGRSADDAARAAEQRAAADTRTLQNERDQAEAASLAKTRFLANMSHELRTPLNAVIGAAQLLQQGGQAPEEQAHLIDAIRGSGTNLLGLIENILDLSRIETGALELAESDFNLVDCVESAVANTAVGARMKRLAMACIVDPALPAWRNGDSPRLRQILLNLLGNAVKFTEAARWCCRWSGAAHRQRSYSASWIPAWASPTRRARTSSIRSARATNA